MWERLSWHCWLWRLGRGHSHVARRLLEARKLEKAGESILPQSVQDCSLGFHCWDPLETSDRQNSKGMNLCYFKPPSLGQSVTAPTAHECRLGTISSLKTISPCFPVSLPAVGTATVQCVTLSSGLHLHTFPSILVFLFATFQSTTVEGRAFLTPFF